MKPFVNLLAKKLYVLGTMISLCLLAHPNRGECQSITEPELRVLTYFPNLHEHQGVGFSIKITHYNRLALLFGYKIRDRDPDTNLSKRLKDSKLYVRKYLKGELLKSLSNENFIALLSSSDSGLEVLTDLLGRGLLSDIEKSRYVLKDECRDGDDKPRNGLGVEKEASTEYRLNAPICIDLRMILSNFQLDHKDWDFDQFKQEIKALILHEHLHHFGIRDQDARYYFHIREAMKLTSWKVSSKPKKLEVPKEFSDNRMTFRRSVAKELNDYQSTTSRTCKISWPGKNNPLSEDDLQKIEQFFSRIQLQRNKFVPSMFDLTSVHSGGPVFPLKALEFEAWGLMGAEALNGRLGLKTVPPLLPFARVAPNGDIMFEIGLIHSIPNRKNEPEWEAYFKAHPLSYDLPAHLLHEELARAMDVRAIGYGICTFN